MESQLIYLFDYDFKSKNDQDYTMTLYGYLNNQPIQLQTTYDIYADINLDEQLFKPETQSDDQAKNKFISFLKQSFDQSRENQKTRKYKDFQYTNCELLQYQQPFKGKQSIFNQQRIVRFYFSNFKNYQEFIYNIDKLNLQIKQELKKKEISSSYSNLLSMKQQNYLKNFILYSNVCELSANEKNQCLLYIAQNRHNGIQMFTNMLQQVKYKNFHNKLQTLKDNYRFSTELDKQPFRLMENDDKDKYIMKLIRQNKFQLSGYNIVNGRLVVSPSGLITSKVDIKDIIFIEHEDAQKYISNNQCLNQQVKMYQSQCPLTILTWDIEVCTQTGKFDNDGSNPNNVVLCIGMSFGNIVSTEDKRLKICIVFVDCDQESLSFDQFEYKIKTGNTQIKNSQDMFEGNLNKNSHYIIKCQDEKSMLITWFKVISLLKPSFLTGFNDFQFDHPFIRQKLSCLITDRTQEKQVLDTLKLDYENYITLDKIYTIKSIKISASDNKNGCFLNIPGMISIDTRIMLINSQKLEKKSLNEYLKANNLESKLDVSFSEMNRAFKELYDVQNRCSVPQVQNNQFQSNKSILGHVYKYCIYDAEACHLLWNKRSLLQSSIEISKLSYTPLRCAFHNANGIKVRNMIAKFAFDKGFSVPMTKQSNDIRLRDIKTLEKYEKYPGAYVCDAKFGVSITPVSALDFASLYPSIIMAHNLSLETVIEPFDYLELNNKTTKIEIPFNKDGDSTVITGNVLDRNIQVGVYPTILEDLFKRRKVIKNEMGQLQDKYDLNKELSNEQRIEIEYQITLLNCKQLAVKVFMNTFYGETGNQNSPLFDLLISGGTTTIGQKYIKQVHNYIRENDCEIVYGDSIVGDEPLLLKDQFGNIHIKAVQDLVDDQQYTPYGYDKQQGQSQYLIWTHNNWLPIQRVIKHTTQKKIFQVSTKDSIVQVTEDHSLMSIDLQQIKPQTCIPMQTKILQCFPTDKVQSSSIKEQINKQKQKLLELKGFLFKYYKSIPADIINETNTNVSYFLNGVCQNYRIDTQSKIIAQQLYYLFKRQSISIEIKSQIKRNGQIRYTINCARYTINCIGDDTEQNIVQSVTQIPKPQNIQVYDIETSAGIFNAGIGSMVLKNTDSVYFRPKFGHFKQYKALTKTNDYQMQNSVCRLSSEMLESAYNATEKLKIEINRMIGEQTYNFVRMEFEELLFPSIFTGKKKYCGVVYVPGKMQIKSNIVIKDVLLKGIDFIKSQYPDIIKQYGEKTIISILSYFQSHIDNQLNEQNIEQYFEDSYRHQLNQHLKLLISDQIKNIYRDLNNIDPLSYNLLGTKKRMRAVKTGEMMLFRQRLCNTKNVEEYLIHNSIEQIGLQIDIRELQQLGISTPEEGEVLDLIYIEQHRLLGKLKSSQKIHLLEYAIKNKMKFDIRKYYQMYRTSASRIAISVFIDPDTNDEDQAQQLSKQFCDQVFNQLLNADILTRQQENDQCEELVTKYNIQDLKQITNLQYLYNQVLQLLESILIKQPVNVYKQHYQKPQDKTTKTLSSFNSVDGLDQLLNSQLINSISLLYSNYKEVFNTLLFILNTPQSTNKIIYISESKPQYMHYFDNIFKEFNPLIVIEILELIVGIRIQIQETEKENQIQINTAQMIDYCINMIQHMEWVSQLNKCTTEPILEYSQLNNWVFNQKVQFIEYYKKSEREKIKCIQKPNNKKFDLMKLQLIHKLFIQEKVNLQIYESFEQSMWDITYRNAKKYTNHYNEWISYQLSNQKLVQQRKIKLLKIIRQQE